MRTAALSGLAMALVFGPAHLALGTEKAVGPEFQVNTYTTGDQTYPVVARTTGGSFVIAWNSATQDGGYPGIMARRYAADGTAQGGEFQVSSYHTNYYEQYPAIASAADGSFVVAWTSTDSDGSYFNVYSRRYNTAGAPAAAEFQVNTNPLSTGYSSYPIGASVGSDTAGNFVVAWMSYDPYSYLFRASARRYTKNGSPAGSAFQVGTATTNLTDQYFPVVASAPAGDFMVVWTSTDATGNQQDIFAQRYTSAGTAAGSEFQVNTYTAGDQYYPDIAATSAGNFIVVWSSNAQDGNGLGIFGQRFNSAGARLGTEFQVNLYTTGDQATPRVSSDGDGGFVVVWSSQNQDGGGSGVFGRHYDTNGNPDPHEFAVNLTTANDQVLPAVAALSATDTVVTWASASQDGNGNAVEARRFTRVQCIGDCNQDGRVTINEILTATRIALSTSPRSACPQADANQDGLVLVDELINGVDAARDGCR